MTKCFNPVTCNSRLFPELLETKATLRIIDGYYTTCICQNDSLRSARVVIVIGQGNFRFHVSPCVNHYVSICGQLARIECSGRVIAERNPMGLTAFAW